MTTTPKIALLEDRGVVAVTGEDAGKFLQGLTTNDMDLLETQGAIFAALLSPQGKVLFDFLVVKQGDGFLLDAAKDQVDALAKRLGMYKLRAKVELSILRDASVGGAFGQGTSADWHIDPRLAQLGRRLISARAIAATGTSDDYNAHRIALGVPEGGKDYGWGEVFPHEANMDVLNGVSFTKGCYVGQEIVARMEHRGTARRRFVRVMSGDGALPPAGTEVRAGDVTIGVLGSSAGSYGLAMLRLDRVAEFEAQGVPLTAAGMSISPDASDLARLSPRTESTAP